MASFDFQLSKPPEDSRQRELWLQHAIGFILCQDVRVYAMQKIDQTLSDEAKGAASKSIDDALYGLMMVLDGITGALKNDDERVQLRVNAELISSANGEVVQSLDLMDGDGMCMGYHDWIENDYGNPPPFLESSND